MTIKTLKDLKDKFNSVLKEVPVKLNLINNEIKEVESYLDFIPIINTQRYQYSNNYKYNFTNSISHIL